MSDMPDVPDLAVAKSNMVLNQIRAWEVLDERVLGVIDAVARADFVPPAYRNLAYADLMVPLAHGQFMWPPKLEARMVQALAIRPTDAVLEIGTGSGYVTALLARLGAYVTSVDLYPEFAEQAGARLAACGLRNVRLDVGNAASGWPANGPYDVVLVTGSVPEIPRGMLESLRPGGRLGIVVGRGTFMHATVVVCEGPGQYQVTQLLETTVPSLEHVSLRRGFEF